MRRAFSIFCAILLFSAPLAAQAASDGAVLQPGDVLRITVWENEAMSGEVPVGPDGALMHPLYRQVRVAGVPLGEVDARIRAFLERFVTNPQFVAEPLLRVAMGGEVRQPNLYSLSPGTTVTQAVVLAGGPTERGRLDRVRMVRGGRESLLDLTDPASPMAATTIQSGDQFYVLRRGPNVFREYIAPAGGLLAAVVSLLNFVTRK